MVTPSGQSGTALTPHTMRIDWSILTVTLGGTPHQSEVWSLTVGGFTRTHTVLLNDTPTSVATALRRRNSIRFPEPSPAVTALAGVITFNFTAAVGNRQIDGFSITPQPAVASCRSRAPRRSPF